MANGQRTKSTDKAADARPLTFIPFIGPVIPRATDSVQVDVTLRVTLRHGAEGLAVALVLVHLLQSDGVLGGIGPSCLLRLEESQLLRVLAHHPLDLQLFEGFLVVELVVARGHRAARARRSTELVADARLMPLFKLREELRLDYVCFLLRRLEGGGATTRHGEMSGSKWGG